MPRPKYPFKITITDSINNREFSVGFKRGIFKGQYHIVVNENSNGKKIKTETLSYITKINTALSKKIITYLKTIEMND